MPYYKKVLQPEEKVLYNERLHWIVYLRAVFFASLWSAVFLGVEATAHDRQIFIGILAVIYLYLFTSTWLRRVTTEIVVTDKRVIYKRGLIFRETMEMNMNKVETVDVSQSIFGRLLGYGTVLIRGSGSTYAPLRNVTKPLDLRNSIIVR